MCIKGTGVMLSPKRAGGWWQVRKDHGSGVTSAFLLLWRHNEGDGVSNHHDCLLNRSFRRRSKKTSKLRVTGFFVRGTHRWPVNSPHKWLVTRKMFLFDGVIMFSGITFKRDNDIYGPKKISEGFDNMCHWTMLWAEQLWHSWVYFSNWRQVQM